MPNVSVAYNSQSLDNTFGEYISKLGLKQLRIAEFTKYAHVTFFFNGGVEAVYEGEDRVLIPTADVATFDLKPEMSAYEVTDELIKRIESDKYDVIVANFANCDMVGHTGMFEAAVKAVQAVDECVGRITSVVSKKGGVSFVTADHGNADKMKEADGSPFTAHTTNKVPFIVVGFDCTLRDGGMLADIAPTMLDIMELKVPSEMTGTSLIKK
jgi:2,3-bisphosphoglycerate-independent phosphoglycerate mutase